MERRRSYKLCWTLLAFIAGGGLVVGLFAYVIALNITHSTKDVSLLLGAASINEFVLDESGTIVSVITAGIFALIAAHVLDDLNVGGSGSQSNKISPVVLFLAASLAYVTAVVAIVLALTSFAPLLDACYSAFYKSVVIYLYCAILLVVSVQGPYVRNLESESNELSKFKIGHAAKEIVDSLEPDWSDCKWTFKEIQEFGVRVILLAAIPAILVVVIIYFEVGFLPILPWLTVIFCALYGVSGNLIINEFNEYSRILRQAYGSNHLFIGILCIALTIVLLMASIYVGLAGAWVASIVAIACELTIIALARKILWNDRIKKRCIFNLVRYDEQLQSELLAKGAAAKREAKDLEDFDLDLEEEEAELQSVISHWKAIF